MRESIWSIPPRWRAAYFFLFTIQSLLGAGLLSWYEITQRTEDTVVETIMAIVSGMGPIGLGAAVSTILITEVMQYAMTTRDYLRQVLIEPLKERQQAKWRSQGLAEGRVEGRVKGLAEGRVEGLAEGRAEERAAWEAWNQRRMDAEAEGKPFDELPPSMQDGSTGYTNGAESR